MSFRPKFSALAALAASPGSRRRCLWVATAGLIMAGLTGCQNVRPWERGTLGDITMRPDRDPLGMAYNEHIWFSREAASGGRGVGGGGCGCN